MASLSREHGIAIGILKRGKMGKCSKRVMAKCKAWPRAMVAAIWSRWDNKPCWLISLVLFENRKKLPKFHIRKLNMIINNIFGVGESLRNIMAFGQIGVLCLCRVKLNEKTTKVIIWHKTTHMSRVKSWNLSHLAYCIVKVSVVIYHKLICIVKVKVYHSISYGIIAFYPSIEDIGTGGAPLPGGP